MKIVILSDDFPPESVGGADIIASNLANALLTMGHEVSVITNTKIKENQGKKIVEQGLRIYRVYSNYSIRFRAYTSLYNPRVIKHIENILKEINPDIIHSHNVHRHLSYYSLVLANKYSKAVFLTMHDLMSVHYGKLGSHIDKNGKVVVDPITPLKQLSQQKFRYNPLRNLFIKYCLRKVNKIFAVSKSLKNVLESQGILNIEVLHNGIKTSDWVIDEGKLLDFKEKYSLQNKKVLFFAGRLTEIKGGVVALEALEKISSKIENVVLLVVGEKDGWGKKMLEEAEKMGIDKKVVFTGWVPHEDIRYAYSSSNVVLVLSRYLDPFPTINLEAMATSKPVIGTIFGGTPEAVLDNQTGYIVDPNNIEMVSEKVTDLIQNEDKAISFGLAGYKRVVEMFSQKVWVERTISCYTTTLKLKSNGI